MIRSIIALLVAGAALIAPGFPVVPSLARQDDEPIKLRTNLVTVDATVLDRDGNFIRNLKADDFIVYEDNEPQKLDFFEASEEAALTRPLAVVFALDNSGSMKPEELAMQREAALSFTRLVRPESVFAVLTFNNELRVLQDFTSDPKKIGQAFQKVAGSNGSTRLFASIDRAVAMLKRAPRYRSNRRLRRIVVVITDGIDSVDTVDQRDLVQRATEQGVTVYSITIPSYGYGSTQRIMTLLDVSRIVPLTGGADFPVDAGNFTPVFKAIAEEIKSSYTLAYYPKERSKRDNRPRQLRVEAKREGSVVRASRSAFQE